MKVYIIGDLHGHRTWEQALDRFGEPGPDNRYIILGDYFDSFTITLDDAIDNFIKMMDYKRSLDSDKSQYFTVLIGNHDYHYLIHESSRPYNEVYSGFSYQNWEKIKLAITDNMDLIKIAHKIEDDNIVMLFSHAGISTKWLERTNVSIDNILTKTVKQVYDKETAEDRDILLSMGFYYGNMKSPTGDDPESGLLWIRPLSLSTAMFEYNGMFTYQFIGHTQRRVRNADDDEEWTITRDYDTGRLIENGCIVLCDTGPYVTVYDSVTTSIKKIMV